MTHRRAPEAVLVALAEAVDAQYRKTGADVPMWLAPHLAAYREAVAPLRTRAEVEDDRLSIAASLANGECDFKWFKWRWDQLCSEPTADETEEATGERERLESAIAELVTWDVARSWGGADKRGGVLLRFDNGSRKDEQLSELCRELARLGKRGTEPNATTDHGADLRDPEPCSCDQTLELQRRLREIRAECASYLDLNKGANLVVYAIKRIAGAP